jgi:acetolactate synthase regulatory subunit
VTPTQTLIRPAPAPSVRGRERHLALETTDDPDVLLRVLVLLRRRGFVVRRVDFRAGDRHAPTRFRLALGGGARPAHQLEAWVSNVVGVFGARVE